MRVGIRTSAFTAPSADAKYRISAVTTGMFRNLWFRVNVAAPTYTVDVYPTKTDATNQTNRLATATHGAGDAVAVTLSLAASPPFTITPSSLAVDAAGTWFGPILCGYVDDIETWLVEQMVTVLNRYLAANESLAIAGVKTISVGHKTPVDLPAVAVTIGDSTPRDLPGGPHDEIKVGVDLWVWGGKSEAAETMKAIATIAGALRSIAADEQRVWGWGYNLSHGPVLGTEFGGPMMVSRPIEDGNAIYGAHLPLQVQIVNCTDADAPVVAGTYGLGGSGKGGGGKYGDPAS